MRRILLTLLMLLVLLSAVPAAFATETTEAPQETTAAVTEATEEATEPEETEEETVEETEEETEATRGSAPTSGTCGEGLTWTLDNGTLTVSGSGAMNAAPWEDSREDIKRVILTGGVTAVAENAFYDCDNLTYVDFGDALKEIDTRAFYDCDNLDDLQLPATFRRFGTESFRDCTGLTTIYCDGGMPSFNGNCLWNGNQVTIYTPVNNPWPQEYVEELVNNFGGRLQIMAGDNPVYDYTEPTEAPETTAVPTTEAMTEPTTVPTTEAPTEPTTIPTTAPVQTQAPTEPAVTETVAAMVQEEEPLPPQNKKMIIWIAVAAASLTGLLVLALVIRGIRHKDGQYKD